MLWFIGNQITIVASAAALGTLVATGLVYLRASLPLWRIVDLVWIVIGGIGALTAFIVSLYLSEIGSTQRSVDLSRSKISSLNANAIAAHTKYCNDNENIRILPNFSSDYTVLCGAISTIAQQTSDESDAYKLIGLLETENRRNLDKFSGTDLWEQMGLNVSEISPQDPNLKDFGNDPLKIFSLMAADDWNAFFFQTDLDSPTLINSEINLIQSGIYSPFVYEFQSLKLNLEAVTIEFEQISAVWARLIEQRWLLMVQTIALSMLAFCLPLRIGKSVNEIVIN